MSDGERLVMYAPMADLRRNEKLPSYSSIRLTLLTPRSPRPRTSTGLLLLHFMCWRTHLRDAGEECPPEFGVPNLTGQ